MQARERRAVRIGIVAIALLLLMRTGVPWLQQWRDGQRVRSESVQLELARLRSESLNTNALRDSASARRSRLNLLSRSLLRAPNSQEAAADLSAAVEGYCAEHSMNLVSLTLLADSTVRLGLTMIGVRLVTDAGILALARFIADVESDDRHLVIRELTVSQSDPSASESVAEQLRIEVLVQALAAVDSSGAGD